MNRIIKAVFALMLIVPQSALCDELTPAKEKDIRLVLEMTGSASIVEQFSQALVGQFLRNANLKWAEKQIIQEEVGNVLSENVSTFTSSMVKLYSKHFTHKEIKSLIKFYKTDLGKKTITTMPILIQEGFQMGREWGESLQPEFEVRLKARLEKLHAEREENQPQKGPAAKDKKN